MHKKGVSPYLAYILLVAMSITIATFGIRYITDNSLKNAENIQDVIVNYLECDDIDIKVSQLCQDDSFIYFNLENTGNNDIRGFYVSIHYLNQESSNYIEKTMLMPMEKWNYKMLKLDMVLGLEITPMIGSLNNRNVCSNRIYKFNDIAYCK